MTPCPDVHIRDREPRGGNNLRRYETIFITRADMPSETMDGIVERYRNLVSSLGGVVVRIENWGKRKLAYLIKKQRHGHYILVNFVSDDKVLAEFERNLKFDEDVLRAQSVRLSDKVDMNEIEQEIAEARKKEEADSLRAEEKEKQSQDVAEEVAESDTEPPVEQFEDSEEKEKGGEE
jgi:small subunit ribosomal protein S6